MTGSKGGCDKSDYQLLFCLADKTFELIEQYERIDDNEVRISFLELISIYYSSLFYATDKLHPKRLCCELDHTEEEAAVSGLVIEWRNAMAVHAVPGEGDLPRGLSSSADCGSLLGGLYDRKRQQAPLHPLHLQTLKSSLDKIQRLCRKKIAERDRAEGG